MASRKKKKQDARDRNDGKEYEALLLRIESTVRQCGAGVVPDVRETDRNGAKRQIDLVVTLPGSPQRRVAFECRDRSRASDIAWIDQCVGKYIDLEFDRVVVVSTKAVGPTARRKAERHGIEVRTCSELTPAEIASMVGNLKIYVDHDFGRIEWVEIETHTTKEDDAPLADLTLPGASEAEDTVDLAKLPLFTDEHGTARITVGDMLTLAQRQGWRANPGSLTSMTPTTATARPEDVFVESSAGLRKVRAVTMGFVGANMRSEIPLRHYRDEGPTTRFVADGAWTDHEEARRFDVTVVGTDDGQLRLRVARRRLERDSP